MNHQELVKKYDTNAPRYTSYPPVPFWLECPSEEEWFKILENRLQKSPTLDLYLHIPFCRSICHYCGCNRIVQNNKEEMERFIETLLMEFNYYHERLPTFSLDWLHLGGGTPTLLEPKHLDLLFASIFSKIKKGPAFQASIEADPRVTTREHLELLRSYSFERISFGVQDTSIDVQKIIGRITSVELFRKVVAMSRENGFKEINFDLIFGLPGQTLFSIEETFKEVGHLRPETIAYYSYAHVPEFAPNQKNIDPTLLPSGDAKRALYEKGKELLLTLGYVEIGLDHFALPGSNLHLAHQKKILKRSFMGHTATKNPVTLALGPSSISCATEAYVQNEKRVDEYEKIVRTKKLPIVKGHCLSPLDIKCSEVIEEILCNRECSLLGFEDIDLSTFIQDEVVTVDHKKLYVTENGRPFVRNVAMAFDHYLKDRKNLSGFSRTI